MVNMTELEKLLRIYTHHANYCLDVEDVNYSKLAHGEWYIEDKKDGVYANIFVLTSADGYHKEVRAFSRDGKSLSNLQWVERCFAYAPCGVYMGEALIINGVFEDASRFFNPNVVNQLDLQPGQSSFISLFDYVSIESFMSGKCEIPYHRRKSQLKWIHKEYLDYRLTEVIEDYNCESFNEALQLATMHVDTRADLEGVVLRHADSIWKRGVRNEDTIKLVRYRFYDLRVVSIKVGKGKHACVVGALVVAWKAFGKKENPYIKIPVDGKISYDQRREWYVKHSANAYLEGKIAKVRAKGLTNKGMLRQPKLIEIRWDKREADL